MRRSCNEELGDGPVAGRIFGAAVRTLTADGFGSEPLVAPGPPIPKVIMTQFDRQRRTHGTGGSAADGRKCENRWAKISALEQPLECEA